MTHISKREVQSSLYVCINLRQAEEEIQQRLQASREVEYWVAKFTKGEIDLLDYLDAVDTFVEGVPIDQYCEEVDDNLTELLHYEK